MEDFLKVGTITTTHGVRGEVKVYPTTDDPERFLDLKRVLVDTGKEMVPLTIKGVKFFKNLVILKFTEIDNINDVINYKGMDLLIPREEGVELDEDEYYIADLIGMEVYLEDGTRYGTLKDVMETGANDVYIVKKESGGEILLPAIHECILDVNPEEGKMTVHLMKGLE
ncbi:MAG: 16S rRNA processing protein RimM [Blautia sp.]|nr:16S rRNA processing protein RimM [Blautia sp.]